MVECKWEKEAIEASVIRELHGKVSNRIDVKGILISMSGFTQGAVTQVEDYINSKLIVLFGGQDVRGLIDRRTSFNELLDEKYKNLVTKKKALFH